MAHGPNQPFRVQLKQPEDGTPGGRSVALVDSVTGKLRGVQDSRSVTGGPWINQYVDAIHTGEIGGWPLRLAYAMARIAISVQSFTGVALWILRRKKTQPDTDTSSRS
ncbi:MAG TPA: PepSY-associated TM helix domain-containing protein [Pirellulaceae bacterium]|nr:PepSY domain-containing protein [Planctomycetales bacterium]HRX81095.1 PepSY-associated TM helix domain-containing protein [Pirellulaceae bacterium]